METDQTCLSEIEGILPELARRIGAEYSPGTDSEAASRFIASGANAQEWHLAGKSGIRVTVLWERFEGDSFVSAHGSAVALPHLTSPPK